MIAPVESQAQGRIAGQGMQTLPAQQNPALVAPSTLKRGSPSEIPTKKPEADPLNEVHMEPSQQKNERAAMETLPFMVEQIRFEGITHFTPEQVYALASSYVGTEQTLSRINTLVDALAALYREQGYLTTEVYIPPQTIENGVLTIAVQEGTVGKVRVEGNHFYRARLVDRSISAEPGKLLNLRTLEKELNHINRFSPGFRVRASIAAGERPGQSDLKLQLAERQPFQISGTYDNQGRPFIGLYRTGVEFRNDSLLGLGDRFQGRWMMSEGTQVAMAAYSVPLNRFGTELSGMFAYSGVQLQLNTLGEAPDIRGKAYNGNLRLSQPLGSERRWTVDAGLSWSRVSSYFEEMETDMTDIRALQFGLSYERPDRWGYTYNRVQNTIALGGLGGTSRFWKVDNYFNRVLFLPKGNLVILKGYAQFTPDGLPSAENFQLGGQSSVRGYTEGLLFGDHGFNVGIEHRFPIPLLSRLSPKLAERVQLAWFYDFGRVWTNRNNDLYDHIFSNLPERTLLQGAGFGFRAQLTRFMQGFVDFGFGLNDRKNVEPERRQPTARIHFGIRSDLLSQDYRFRPEPFRFLNMKPKLLRQ